MAQRKEKTLGYEGRYRRTLSPSGLASRSPDSMQQQQSGRSNDNSGSSDQIPDKSDPESSLSPTAWEKYHNIRPPSTTVIFTSQELANASLPSKGFPNGLNPQLSQAPGFHRSISCDSNLFNNKTGFTQPPQNAVPGSPPVAQVAPLRGPQSSVVSDLHHRILNGSQPDVSQFSPQFQSTIFEPIEFTPTKFNTSSLKYKCAAGSEGTDGPQYFDAGVQSPDFSKTRPHSLNQSPMVKVSPLRSISFGGATTRITENKENIPSLNQSVECLVDKGIDFRVTSDASSQTDSGNEDEFLPEKVMNQAEVGSEGSMSMEPSILSLRGLSSSPSTCSSSSSTCSAGDLGLGTGGGSNVPYSTRQKSQEELECEKLSRDLLKQLPQGDKLYSLLVPSKDRKTSAHYMEGLFNIQPESKKDQDEIDAKGDFSQSSNNARSIETKTNGLDMGSSHGSPQPRLDDSEIVLPNENVHKRSNGHAPLPADSAYFTTSECKAKFLTQYVNDIHSESNSQTDSKELNKQKEELVSRLSKKLEALRIIQSDIREEIKGNEQLGQTVVERVKETAKRNEFDKFKLHVEEIEKITSLLLGLSGRLARAENALMALNENPSPPEKEILESKRDKLKEQLDEAKVLKESIDRRSAQVAGFLEKYLSPEEYADYHHFRKQKAQLIIDAREIDDKIKLGEEQMLALQETLNKSM